MLSESEMQRAARWYCEHYGMDPDADVIAPPPVSGDVVLDVLRYEKQWQQQAREIRRLEAAWNAIHGAKDSDGRDG